MASKLFLSASSALPAQQKRNIHINECVRRLQNCDPDMSWEERKEFLQDYVIRMYHAGYSESFRQDVIKQAIARYEGMLKADGDGHHPLYRPRDWKEQERKEQRGRKKKDWFATGQHVYTRGLSQATRGNTKTLPYGNILRWFMRVT